MQQQNMGGLGLGFILGAIVGIGIGMLYAPRSGIETRAMLSDKVDELKEKLDEAVDTVKNKVEALTEHAEQAT